MLRSYMAIKMAPTFRRYITDDCLKSLGLQCHSGCLRETSGAPNAQYLQQKCNCEGIYFIM